MPRDLNKLRERHRSFDAFEVRQPDNPRRCIEAMRRPGTSCVERAWRS